MLHDGIAEKVVADADKNPKTLRFTTKKFIRFEVKHTIMNPIPYIKKSLQDRRLNVNRNTAVERGEFLYYIVSERTNVRKRYDDGTIVIYNDKEIAEIECGCQEEKIRVSDFNEIYGRFMEK
jgi:hypothetical protein